MSKGIKKSEVLKRMQRGAFIRIRRRYETARYYYSTTLVEDFTQEYGSNVHGGTLNALAGQLKAVRRLVNGSEVDLDHVPCVADGDTTETYYTLNEEKP